MADLFYKSDFKQGWIEIIIGCMFSGKTEELIRLLRRCELSKLSFQVFKPGLDSRYSKNNVASHNQNKFPCTIVDEAKDILKNLNKNVDVVGIDEAQFFNEDIVDVVNELANSGKRVIIAGLEADWKGRPFGPMPRLITLADDIKKLHAICMICGAPATKTQRLVREEASILVGSTESYEARCRRHFNPDLNIRADRMNNVSLDSTMLEL